MASTAVRTRGSRRQRIALTLFILSPLAVLTGLCVWMYFEIQAAPHMSAPPRGAGAGHTGMSNEYIGVGRDRPQAPPAPTGSPAPTSPAPSP